MAMANVRFTGDYFSLVTMVDTAQAKDWDSIVDDAAALIRDMYGWDVEGACNDIEVFFDNDDRKRFS